MSSLRDLPEVAGLDARHNLIRIPPELDVPLTPRVRRIIDTPEFRRLGRVNQLGLVSIAYPAATHSRFEHSLGVYRLALLFLKQLSHDARFASVVDSSQAEVFIVAALLHDIGHWPFCHPIEDLRLPQLPRHEELARRYILRGELAEALRVDWGIEPAEVVALLSGEVASQGGKILASMLSSPIDIDKMDYLPRDSLHAGVPYGRHFDQQRLIGSLCLNEAGDGLAITEKGKTAAEMMVFARYVMFSEVYWHHTVRSATAMLQRAFSLLCERLELEQVLMFGDAELMRRLQSLAPGGPAADLLDGLFGSRRRVYKRLAQFSYFEDRETYERLARRPYAWLVRVAEQFARLAGDSVGKRIEPHHVLFDAPPVEREVEFNVDVYFLKEKRYRRLVDVSPVVRTLAKEQFDDYVKRVRVFVHADVVEPLRQLGNATQLIELAIEQAEVGAA
jgi:HD superfamily phosphohydrolase